MRPRPCAMTPADGSFTENTIICIFFPSASPGRIFQTVSNANGKSVAGGWANCHGRGNSASGYLRRALFRSLAAKAIIFPATLRTTTLLRLLLREQGNLDGPGAGIVSNRCGRHPPEKFQINAQGVLNRKSKPGRWGGRRRRCHHRTALTNGENWLRRA